MAARLRFFLYRDDPVVSQFLEQLDGGVYDEESIRRQGSSTGMIGGGVKAGPVKAEASRRRTSDEESQLNLRQTGASRFSRFHDLADDAENIQTLDAIDEAIWDQVETGEVVDAAVTLAVPPFLKSLDLVSRASAMIPFFDAFSSMEGDDGKPLIDPNEIRTVKRQLPAMEQAATMTEDAPMPIVASLASDPKFKFFVRLKRANILIDDLQDLEGEARLVTSIQSKVARGKPAQVGQLLPGMPSQNRAQRRRSGSSDNGSVTLRYPAAIVTPIAIFR